MHRIVKTIKRHKAVFILKLYLLRGLLKGGKHAALAAGKVLAGGAVLSHLHQYLLQKLELIGDEGIGLHKLVFAGITLQIGDRARRKGK